MTHNPLTAACKILMAILLLCMHLSAMGSSNGLAPCKGDGTGYYQEVDSLIDGEVNGKTLLKFTTFPSFDYEWGVRVIHRDNRYFLRHVQFEHSVWYSAFDQVGPHTFDRVPEKALTTHSIHEVEVDEDFAHLLNEAVKRENAAANAANEHMVLDGDFYYFRSEDGSCGRATSPGMYTRGGELVSLFENLARMTKTPMPFRSVWKVKALSNIGLLQENAMPISIYPQAVLVCIFLMIVAGLPFLVAALTAFIPRGLQGKRLFILAAGTSAYTITILGALFLLPAFLTGNFLAESIRDGGFVWLADASGLISSHYFQILICLLVLASVCIPLLFRVRVWAALLSRFKRIGT